MASGEWGVFDLGDEVEIYPTVGERNFTTGRVIGSEGNPARWRVVGLRTDGTPFSTLAKQHELRVVAKIAAATAGPNGYKPEVGDLVVIVSRGERVVGLVDSVLAAGICAIRYAPTRCMTSAPEGIVLICKSRGGALQPGDYIQYAARDADKMLYGIVDKATDYGDVRYRPCDREGWRVVGSSALSEALPIGSVMPSALFYRGAWHTRTYKSEGPTGAEAPTPPAGANGPSASPFRSFAVGDQVRFKNPEGWQHAEIVGVEGAPLSTLLVATTAKLPYTAPQLRGPLSPLDVPAADDLAFALFASDKAVQAYVAKRGEHPQTDPPSPGFMEVMRHAWRLGTDPENKVEHHWRARACVRAVDAVLLLLQGVKA